MPDDNKDQLLSSTREAFLTGARGAFSGPAWVLLFSFFGFGALTQDLGFSLFQSGLIALGVYALPGQVVLVTGMASGIALFPLFLAVSFSAVRLMPMTVSLMPMMRHEGTRKWKLYLLSHFVAVTNWIEALRRLPMVPRELRLSYFTGFCLVMTLISVFGTMGGFLMATSLPPVVAGAMLFLMPIYFLVTLSSSARALADKYAFLIGFCLGPPMFLVFPEGDLVVTGLVGGTLGWFVARLSKGQVAA